MDGPDDLVSFSDLQRRRVEIMRGFARANAAAVAVVLGVIALALVAVAAAFQSERNAQRARIASEQARSQLREAKLAQARAERVSGAPGRRAHGLAAVEMAARIEPSLALHSEAIGLLAQTDLEEASAFWPHATNIDEGSLAFDANLERYAWGDLEGWVHIHGLADHRELAHRVWCSRFSVFSAPPAA